MYRTQGFEGHFGIGGGHLVSAESERNLDIAKDLCRKHRAAEALPYLNEAMKDPNNIDAMIEMAFIVPSNMTIKAIDAAEARGKAMLKEIYGPNCFENGSPQVGQFWDLLPTRPYMRVLQAQERIFYERKKYFRATATLSEMLRLRPGDNMSARKSLGSALIRNKRYGDALSFAQQWLKPGRDQTPAAGGTIYSEPSDGVYTQEQADAIGVYKCSSELAHTAALASFKYFGDCPQSRQYLRIAARTNPHILLKILARKTQPTSINGRPREINSPEDAHDYLWYTQDLWMTADVWNWVNNTDGVKQYMLKPCCRSGCGQKENESQIAFFKRCSACHLVTYCSQACQKFDWKTHKPKCKEQQLLKESLRSFAAGTIASKDAPMIIAPDFHKEGFVVSSTRHHTK